MSIKIFNSTVIIQSEVKKWQGDNSLTVNHNPKAIIKREKRAKKIPKQYKTKVIPSVCLNPVIIPATCPSKHIISLLHGIKNDIGSNMINKLKQNKPKYIISSYEDTKYFSI